MSGIDNLFGVHTQSVLFRERRAEVIANNLANVDTPNFKARDLDFNQYLSNLNSEAATKPIEKSHDSHIAMEQNGFSDQYLYRIPVSTSMNGNTVDNQLEIGEYSENAIRYSASLNFLNSKVRSIISALRGE